MLEGIFYIDVKVRANAAELGNASRADPDAWRIAEIQCLVVGLLRPLSAPGSDGIGALRHPLGRRHIERQAAAIGAMREVRPQGRDATASGLDQFDCRLRAVSGA